MQDDNVIKLEKRVKSMSVHNQDSKNAHKVSCCSFCGKPETEVLKLIKGPNANICSECTMIAVQYLVMNDRMPVEAQQILDTFWGVSKK